MGLTPLNKPLYDWGELEKVFKKKGYLRKQVEVLFLRRGKSVLIRGRLTGASRTLSGICQVHIRATGVILQSGVLKTHTFKHAIPFLAPDTAIKSVVLIGRYRTPLRLLYEADMFLLSRITKTEDEALALTRYYFG